MKEQIVLYSQNRLECIEPDSKLGLDQYGVEKSRANNPMQNSTEDFQKKKQIIH